METLVMLTCTPSLSNSSPFSTAELSPLIISIRNVVSAIINAPASR